jgi:trk system potassium uptake protein TrkH
MVVNQPVTEVVARPVGLVMLVAAASMALTAIVSAAFTLVDGADSLADTAPLAVSAPISALLGWGLLRYGRAVPESHALDRGEASLAVTAIWTLLGAVGGLPLMLGAHTPFADAFFEAVSGFTTTGATIYGDIEHTLTRPLNLWRGVMHWLGGMGIVVLFVAVFPNIGVSGKNMFKSEVPGVIEEGLRPRIAETSMALWQVYFAMTVACAGLMWAVGLSLHDALVHSMGTLSTGGFSTRDASIAAFKNPALDWLTATFMLMSGVNFGLYYAMLRTRQARVLTSSMELRVYVIGVVLTTAALTFLLRHQHADWLTALRYAYFRVATSLTSTGFGLDDHATYGPGAMFLMIGLMFVGGCAGSTAGGIKVSRIVILVETAIAEVRRSIRPGVVRVVRVDGRPVAPEVLQEVSTFFFIFLASMGVTMGGVIALDGVPMATAFGATLSALSNMGPAPWYIGADNYGAYSASSKLLFSFAMVIGRLEFFTVLAVFTPEVWRRRTGKASARGRR